MEKLAILGGPKTLREPLPETNNIGAEELEAVRQVLATGQLSDFLGRAGDKFLGGRWVNALEDAFRRRFKVKQAVSFNSATTALDAAVCALGIGPGDEVIVSPYTMSASAMSVLMHHAIPVFADIDEDTFCLDPKSIESRLTKRTRAIMVTNLFGGSARYDKILALAKRRGLKVIEDNAQGPGAMYKGKHLATVGDIGVFSYNIHKQMQAGEGGVLVTDVERYAFRARLRRNHGEQVVDDLGNFEPIVGSNYRMSEVHAAIAIEQLKKLDFLVEKRIALADRLTERLKDFPALKAPFVLPGSKPVYYLYAIRFDSDMAGISRDTFAKALEAEGFPLNQGYLKPLYLLPIFQERKMYPRSAVPFEGSAVDYSIGICPVVERLWRHDLLVTSICRYPLTAEHIDIFVSAIAKVLAQADQLKGKRI